MIQFNKDADTLFEYVGLTEDEIGNMNNYDKLSEEAKRKLAIASIIAILYDNKSVGVVLALTLSELTGQNIDSATSLLDYLDKTMSYEQLIRYSVYLSNILEEDK